MTEKDCHHKGNQRFGKIFFLFFALCIQNSILAQRLEPDNPNLDQVPIQLLSHDLAKLTETDSSVLTIGNWDNFNLGIDFAENNMASNPNLPTWYFTAYNTNGTHHTENGHDWSTNDPSFGVTMRGDPVCAYDSLGNLYYENMYGSPDVLGCKIIKSTDNGKTWLLPVSAIEGFDKNWIACDQTAGPYANYVYTTMTKLSANGLIGNFARSRDFGTTFESTFEPATQSLPGMMVCVGPYNHIQGGAVYIVTNSGDPFASIYTFYRSLDGGASFSLMSSQQFSGVVGTEINNRHSVENMRTRPYPLIAADNSYGSHRGRLYLVYASNDPPGDGNKPDIWSRYSDDGGINWTDALRVNDDVNSAQNNQWHPAIWCDKETGRLYIQWMDTRDTPSSDSATIYATFSDDGGVSFVSNQRISNEKMKINCSTCGGGGTPRYQGDYNGTISNKKVSMLGWTDFRNGKFMSTTAYFPDFAVEIDHTIDTLNLKQDTTRFIVRVPEVKLYTETVMVTGMISPPPLAGTITFLYPIGNVLTSYPDSLPVDIVLNGKVPIGSYSVTFIIQGPNGTPIHKRFAKLIIQHGIGFYIAPTSSPDTICPGISAQLSANPNAGTPPLTFSWTPSTGLNDPSSPNPVASPMITTLYKLTVIDSTLQTDNDSVTVFVNSPPPTPGPISGSQEVCENTIETYSISSVEGGKTYSWTVPDDANIISGQNTPLIQVLWSSLSGNIFVIVGNECGNSNPSVLAIAVNRIPEISGEITGPNSLCQKETAEFAIQEVTGANFYLWDVPSDVIINSGQGTPLLNATWGTKSGNIYVMAENSCGTSYPKNKFVFADTIPEAAGVIIGKDTVCRNHANYFYQIPVIPQATTYQWILPPGAEITSGEGTNEIIVFFNPDASNGNLIVRGVNQCGEGISSSKEIIVSSCLGISDLQSKKEIKIYPNPAKNELILVFKLPEQDFLLIITDLNGKVLLFEKLENTFKGLQKKIDISAIPEGLYILKLTNPDNTYHHKLIIRR